jgi:putative colanic acid biosynthesis glycosyltransferase
VEPGETMKVLLIDVNCKYSSTGKIVYDLYTELNSQGHTASIAYGRGPLVQEAHILKYGIDLETMFHAFLTRVTGLTGSFSWFSTRRLLRHLKQFQPDVVHLHDLHGYHVNIGCVMKYLKQHHIRTIWTFHSEFMYTGKCGHAKDCNNFKTECHNCPYLNDYPKSLYFDFTRFMFRQKKTWFQGFESLLTIVTPSEWLKQRVAHSFLNKMQVVTIPNGVSTSQFRYQPNTTFRQQHGLENQRLMLSVIANLNDPNKGFQWILTYAKELETENISFVVVGKFKHKQYPPNIIAVDYLRDVNALAELYHVCDAYLMVSEYENYPTVCLEASAASLPVIGFDSGGVQETVVGVSSQLVRYGSAELIHIINSFEPQPRQVNKKASQLDVEHMRNRYYELYNQ